MIIGFVLLSIFLLFIFILISSFYYKNREERKFKLSNSFPFELWFDKYDKRNIINALFILSLGIGAAATLFFVITNYRSSLLLYSITNVLAYFFIGSLFIIPISKLKEHFICYFIYQLVSAVSCLLLVFYSYSYYRIDQDIYHLFSIIINSLVSGVSFICLFMPGLEDISMMKDEKGNLVRPSVVKLAVVEWATIILFILSQISLILITLA